MWQGLDTGFKSALGDKARTHVLWAEAVRALQVLLFSCLLTSVACCCHFQASAAAFGRAERLA